jgi:hypothetical protein
MGLRPMPRDFTLWTDPGFIIRRRLRHLPQTPPVSDLHGARVASPHCPTLRQILSNLTDLNNPLKIVYTKYLTPPRGAAPRNSIGAGRPCPAPPSRSRHGHLVFPNRDCKERHRIPTKTQLYLPNGTLTSPAVAASPALSEILTALTKQPASALKNTTNDKPTRSELT